MDENEQIVWNLRFIYPRKREWGEREGGQVGREGKEIDI